MVILDLFEIHCGKNNFCGNLNFPPKEYDFSRMTRAKNKDKLVKNMQSGVSYLLKKLVEKLLDMSRLFF
jgi:hypothetical protein